MKVTLDNAQGVPHLDFVDASGVIVMQVAFCKDGGLVSLKGKTIGTQLGCRVKRKQTSKHKEAKITDGIFLCEI